LSFLVNTTKLCDLYLTERDVIERFIGSALFTWGTGGSGALGDNSSINKSSPVQTVSTGLNWIRACSNGLTGSQGGIKLDGTLWLWGDNSAGNLGNNNTVNRSSPVQTVAAGTNWCNLSFSNTGRSAGLKTDGTLWLWGCGTAGTLGDNNTIRRSSPVQTVATGTNWTSVASGSQHMAGIKRDGTLWMWGLNTTGELGINNIVSRSSPVQTISTTTTWCSVAVSGCATAGLKTDGTLWLWGGNGGTLGNNDTVGRSSPVQTVSTGTNWKQVSVGCTGLGGHVQAIKIDGTLWLWGRNEGGALGNNNTINRSSPVQTVATGTNWRVLASIQAGNRSGAIKTDGTLWLWGCNQNGNLGINSLITQSSPVQTIALGTNWKQVSAGDTTVAVLNKF